jgi:hypothetical protein
MKIAYTRLDLNVINLLYPLFLHDNFDLLSKTQNLFMLNSHSNRLEDKIKD